MLNSSVKRAAKTRQSKLCGFCIYHIWTIVQLFQKYATCFFWHLRHMPFICVFVNLFVLCILYFGVCMFDTWKYNFWYPWTILFSRIWHMLGVSGSSWYAAFVYLNFCICMFSTREYHFWYPWTIPFSKIYNMLGLSGTFSYALFVYLCICVFVFVYLCMRGGDVFVWDLDILS